MFPILGSKYRPKPYKLHISMETTEFTFIMAVSRGSIKKETNIL
jgi:hypothetical protein